MREIKFRVWHNGQIKPACIINNCRHAGLATEIDFGESSASVTLLPEETPIMQYTGLHDKNGKEIYRGGIGKLSSGDPFLPETIVVVVEEMGCFGIIPVESAIDIFGNKYTGKMLPFFPDYQPDNFEIIGNIYENPELLKA